MVRVQRFCIAAPEYQPAAFERQIKFRQWYGRRACKRFVRQDRQSADLSMLLEHQSEIQHPTLELGRKNGGRRCESGRVQLLQLAMLSRELFVKGGRLLKRERLPHLLAVCSVNRGVVGRIDPFHEALGDLGNLFALLGEGRRKNGKQLGKCPSHFF